MEMENIKSPFILKHSITDYLRVAIITLVVLLTIFIVKLFGSRDESSNKKIQNYSGLFSRIDFRK